MYRPRAAARTLTVALILTVAATATAQEADGLQASAAAGLRLRNIGPSLMSGRIADIAIHPRDRATWYVAVGSGGVWKTVNNGTTWTPIFDDQASYSIGAVAIDPSNPETIWVGSGENVSGRHVGFGDGIYRSRDGGRTWQNMGLGATEHISRIRVHPEDSDTVFVAAEGPLWTPGGQRGVFRTRDGGENWEPALEISGETGVIDLAVDPSDPQTMYAAAYQRRRKVWALLAGGPESGIYKSSDGGDTWRELGTGLPSGDMGKIGLAVSPIDPQVVYATIEASADERGFYRSADGGESWERRSSYLSNGTGPHYYQEIYASPHVFDRVYQMDVWLHVTDDGGRTFRELGEPQKHSDNHALAFVAGDEDYLLAGSDGGLYESYDHGASWRYVSNLPVTQIYKMALDNSEPFYNVLGGTQDNGTLHGPARTTAQHGIQNRDWIVPYGADGYAAAVDPDNPDLLYVTWQNGHLLRYDVNTREPLDIQPQPTPTDEPERWNWDAPVIVSPHDSARLYFGSQRLWRSNDRGDSWTAISGDLSRGTNRYEIAIGDNVPGISALYDNGAMSWYGNTTSLSESPLVEGLIYAGTDDGLIQITEDAGSTWRVVDGIAGLTSGFFVNEIKASPSDPDTVFAAVDNHKLGDFSPYVLRSGDRGRTWTSISGDLPDRHLVWSVEQDHLDPELLFVGTELGLFFTTDGGDHWVELTGGVPTIAFRDIEIQRRESDLVASSFGRGFFVLDDYSALRGLDPASLEASAVLFPVRRTYRYVPSVDLGVRGQGYQGSSYWTAPNPPFGALITYHLGEQPQGAREQREAREAEQRAAGEDVPFPGWEALRAEARERDSQIILTITDQGGEVVRRIVGDAGPGLHRIAWDLRYPAPDPIDLNPAPPAIWANPPAGPMVAPGVYQVSLSRVGPAGVESFGSQSFEVLELPGHRVFATGDDDSLAFQRQTAELQRVASGAAGLLSEATDRLAHMRRALIETPAAGLVLSGRFDALDEALADVALTLLGDRVRGRLNEPSLPSVLQRIGQIREGHWFTTEAPTQTFRRSLEIAERQLAAARTALEAALEQLHGLEVELEAEGAPWTPGRRLGNY